MHFGWRNLKLGIVVVNESRDSSLNQCLQAIYSASYPFDIQVFIVDHQTTRDHLTSIKKKYPLVRSWENRSNPVFAASCNQGAHKVRGEYILFMSSNLILQENTIPRLVSFLDENYEVGLIGGKIINKNNQIVHECMRNFPKWQSLYLEQSFMKRFFKKSFYYRDFHRSHDDRSHTLLVDSVACSMAFMIRRDTWKAIGPMDEKLTNELVDIDYCKRAEQKKWQVAYISDAVFQHGNRNSTKPLYSNSLVKELVFLKKYYSKKAQFYFKFGRQLENLLQLRKETIVD